MISVEEALLLVQKNSKTLSPAAIALDKSNQHILAKDVVAPIAMPPFRQSAMDGYALHFTENNTYKIIGEVKAGDAMNYSLLSGEGVRIFTGARVPDTANTVIMQEKTIVRENNITVLSEIKINENIRSIGEQITKDSIALPKGTQLNAAGIGFLAGLGITKVWVYPSPKVGIVITGNELTPPGNPLADGKIYESNYIQLEAALEQLSIKKITKYVVKDEYQSTQDQLENALTQNDIVLVSGGISVGDYDFVGKALKCLGTQEIFYKIKQKPGKPLFFGNYKNTPVFALPGNPASSLTCFYIYVIPLLHQMMGMNTNGLSSVQKKLTADYLKKSDRAEFLKAYTNQHVVTILEGQSSAMLNTYAMANALVYFPSLSKGAKTNEMVTTILL